MAPGPIDRYLDLPLPALPADDALELRAASDEVLLLFDRHAAGVSRYVRSFGLSREAAEDVLQEVFLALFRHIRLGRPRTNMKAWTFQVAHNLALKHRQKIVRRGATECVAWEAVAETARDPAPSAEARLVDDERQRRLRRIVRLLPERDRRCLWLRAEGLTYRDIAHTLDVSLGTVARSLGLAVARLMRADEV